MTEETRQQIKQYETRPDSKYISINSDTLEQIIDDALQAQQERLVSEVERLYFPTEIIEDAESQEYMLAQKYNQAIKDILNLINSPGKCTCPDGCHGQHNAGNGCSVCDKITTSPNPPSN